MTTLSKEAGQLLTWFAILFLAGLFLANPAILYASLIPIFIYLIGVSTHLPKVEVKRIGLTGSAWVGETKETQITGQIKGGIGTVMIYDELPKHFELVEGSNYKVLWKGFRERPFRFSYRVRCTKRGNYYFRGVNWEARHVLGLRAPERGSTEGSSQLVVRPRVFKFRRLRTPQDRAYVMSPMESVVKVGPRSTDFREIRDYLPGDPRRVINWKASARAWARGKVNPLVNEYEREGKQSVWIFLDAHPEMSTGTSVENSFEHAIEVVGGIAYHFLTRGFRLGMYVYNDLGVTLYPETGKKQFYRILEELLKLKPLGVGVHIYWREGLLKAVEKNRKYLITLSPYIVIITHVTPNRVKDLSYGLKRIASYRGKKQRTKTVVVNILPYDLIPTINDLEGFAADLLEARSKGLSRYLRRTGARVLDWNPRDQTLGTKLMNYMKLR